MYQNLLFGAGAGRSRAFIGGAEAGAEIFYQEPEPKKISRFGAEEKWFGSATLLTNNSKQFSKEFSQKYIIVPLLKKKLQMKNSCVFYKEKEMKNSYVFYKEKEMKNSYVFLQRKRDERGKFSFFRHLGKKGYVME